MLKNASAWVLTTPGTLKVLSHSVAQPSQVIIQLCTCYSYAPANLNSQVVQLADLGICGREQDDYISILFCM